MRAATLRDVAEAVGVSARTVSNVVNGYVHVSPETRRKVQEACARLGYRPNATARSLRTGRTGLIALVVPEIAIPYFAELARAVISEARQHGYGVLIDQTDGEAARERDLIQAVAGRRMFDGLIFSPLAISSQELRGGLAIPMVLLGEHVPDSSLDHVGIDNVAAAQDATRHLLERGRRRIAAIGAGARGETADLRTVGFIAAHREAGLDVRAEYLVQVAEFHRDDGADAMRRLLDGSLPPPDALFCYNDLLALGAARVAMECGLRIPEDLAVVGFDDIEEGRYHTPSLTTIAPDKAELARTAVAGVLRRLEGGMDEVPRDVIVPHRLIVRESG
jgi:LacI family transcriptional regulator, repressor for deo operon, udp, cdd, tsx, nupC, and nupG